MFEAAFSSAILYGREAWLKVSIKHVVIFHLPVVKALIIVRISKPTHGTVCVQVWGDAGVFESLSDGCMSHWHWRVVGRVTASWCICWASLGVGGLQRFGGEGELTKWIVPSNQDLNICISTESEPAQKETSIEGKLVWRVNERMRQALCRNTFMPSQVWTESRSFAQILFGKLRPFFSHFFPPCRLPGSQDWTSSRGRMDCWSRTPLHLTVLYVFTLFWWGQTNLLIRHWHSFEPRMSKTKPNPILARMEFAHLFFDIKWRKYIPGLTSKQHQSNIIYIQKSPASLTKVFCLAFCYITVTFDFHYIDRFYV